MYEIITTVTNHHMLILSTARQHCVRNLTFFSVHWMWQGLSYSYEQEVQEIIVVLTGIYINWCTILSLHTMEAYLHLFLTLALDGGQWAASHLGILFLIEIPPATHWMGGGVGPRTILVALKMRKIFCCCCDSNSSLLVQIIAYFYVILGTQN